MEVNAIQPFVRYIHKFPITANYERPSTKAYDNRLFLITRGSGAVVIEKTEYSAEKNDLFLIPSGTVYRLKSEGEEMECIGVNFDYTFMSSHKNYPIVPVDVKDYNADLKLEPVVFSDVQKLNEVVYIKHMGNVRDKLETIIKEYNEKLLYFEVLISHIFFSVLMECVRSLSKSHEETNQKITANVMEYIRDNMDRNISNKEFGEVMHLHPNYINSVIKATTGLSLHGYLLHTKISHSVSLISEQKYTLSEIAEQCGFSDIYHYSKIFKKIMGVPPSKYL